MPSLSFQCRLEATTNIQPLRKEGVKVLDWMRAEVSFHKDIIVPGTTIQGVRLSERGRVILKSIMVKCMDIYNSGRVLEGLSVSKIYVFEHSGSVVIADCKYPKRDKQHTDFPAFLKSVKDVVKTFVSRGESLDTPLDSEHLINYLDDCVQDPNRFNPKVITYHPSLYIMIELSTAIDCLHSHLRYDLSQNHHLVALMHPYSANEDIKDKNGHFWRDARKNERFKTLHDKLFHSKDPLNYHQGLRYSKIAFLVILRHIYHHLGAPLREGDRRYTSLEVDDYIFCLRPAYMSEVMEVLIANDSHYGRGLWN